VEFNKRLSELRKNLTYLVYCKSGNRSRAVVEIMSRLGFENVFNLVGGFSNWEGPTD
jgi:rhodanese-related sulfurtransferase